MRNSIFILLFAFLCNSVSAAETVIDVTFDADYVTEQGWATWSALYPLGSNPTSLPNGTTAAYLPEKFGIIVNPEEAQTSPLRVDPGSVISFGKTGWFSYEAWITYAANNLEIGATYEISAEISTGESHLCDYTVSGWNTASGAPEEGYVTINALIKDDTGTHTNEVLKDSIVATSTSMTFGLGMGRDGGATYKGTQLHSFSLIKTDVPTLETFTITYDANGGVDGEITSEQAIENSFPSLQAAPTRLGYNLDGWKTASDDAFTSSTAITGDITVYAQWQAAELEGSVVISGRAKEGDELTANAADITNNTGTLSYQWQSGTNGTYSNISGATSYTYTLTSSEVDKTIIVIVSSNIQTGSITSAPSAQVADANASFYTVSYNANGGTNGSTTNEEVVEDGNPLLSGNPSKAGHSVTGWNTQADAQGTPFTTSSVITAAITIYAQWEANTYSVSYDPNEGVSGDETTENVIYGTSPNIPEAVAPIREGYALRGWNTKADGTGDAFSSESIVLGNITVYAQWRELSNNVVVDINLNIKHSVDGISDFGRERHITSHTGPTDPDWEDHEDMMNYFFNDLDVYFGRDNGSAGWKNRPVTQDPNKVGWPDVSKIASEGERLKVWYEGSDHLDRHQYESRMGNMIMGMNPYPIYPSLDWASPAQASYAGGQFNSGWQTYDVDAAAFFTAQYLDHHYAKNPNEIGEPLPKYWECMNEPDMAVLKPFVMFLTSFEKLYEFHNLTAQEIRSTLGDKAPKIGGFCWGQHDFWASDWINRVDPKAAYYDYASSNTYATWDNMWLGEGDVNNRSAGAPLYQARNEQWWQWDALFQEFMEVCGANMDFYSVHIYDWPTENNGGTIRTGGHVEAMLDMMEWYDIHKFGTRKEIVLSEYGSVSSYVKGLPYKRRDWENLRPFNQMFLQFLERPSHLVLTMPFAPIKAIWGDWFNADGSLGERYEVTMMDPVGEYTSPGSSHSEWEWSNIILWYELWSDVDGTRIDTKSSNPDIQVDAYVDGNHTYLILNNLELSPENIDLNMFDGYNNKIKSVKIKHQYFDEELELPVNDIQTVNSLPSVVSLKMSSTMILDIEFEDEVTIDQTSEEYKYMSELLSFERNRFGRQQVYVTKNPGEDLTTNINGVELPTIGEATLRVGLKLNNGVRANISVNGTPIIETMTNASQALNVRGRQESRGGNGYWCVLELDVPMNILQENNEVVISCPHSGIDISSVQLQVWDFSTQPGRTLKGQGLVEAIELVLSSESDTIIQGKTMPIEAIFTPENTSFQGLIWTSLDTSIATVNQYGTVTAVASSGTVDIVAMTIDESLNDTITLVAAPYQIVPVTGISIQANDSIAIDYYINTNLTALIEPANASTQSIEWSSSYNRAVSITNEGMLMGKIINKTATITATVIDSLSGNAIFMDSITVYVKQKGDERIFSREAPQMILPETSGTVNIVGVAIGTRTIEIEIFDGNTKIGEGSQTSLLNGERDLSIDYILNVTPEISDTFQMEATFLDGETVIETISVNLEVWDGQTSIKETGVAQLEVYPNPTKGLINIVVTQSPEERPLLEVFNLQGTKVLDKALGLGVEESFDISHLESGFYLLKVGNNVQKLIKN